jgi:hypothetical protein
MNKIFFDCEFTWLIQYTELISIWLISEDWDTFYWKFTDYDVTKCNNWIRENVISNIDISHDNENEFTWTKEFIRSKLLKWIKDKWDNIEVWSDCLSYDWVLFNTLLADYKDWYPNLPSNIYYIPFDICTLMKVKWVDPDITREDFVWYKWETIKHNALFDAKIIKMCYDKLMKI